jgi:hypothetical protein
LDLKIHSGISDFLNQNIEKNAGIQTTKNRPSARVHLTQNIQFWSQGSCHDGSFGFRACDRDQPLSSVSVPVAVVVAVVVVVAVSIPVAVIVAVSIPVRADLMANDATDHSPTDRPSRAATGQNGTPDSPNTSAGRGTLVLS